MLCWSDGRTQFILDFSLHGEKGKIGGKEQGLTSEQRNGRYERKRDKKCHIAKRKEEYFMSKGVKLLDMVKDAIRNATRYISITCWLTVGSHVPNWLISFIAVTRNSIFSVWQRWTTPSI